MISKTYTHTYTAVHACMAANTKHPDSQTRTFKWKKSIKETKITKKSLKLIFLLYKICGYAFCIASHQVIMN